MGIAGVFAHALSALLPATMLTDDILGDEGKPQLYGTNFEFKDGRLVPKPVSDPAGLEGRRERVGPPPLGEYIKGLEELYRVSAGPYAHADAARR